MNPSKPLYKEIPYLPSLDVFTAFQTMPNSLFLDSATSNTPVENTNRYSYIAINPFKMIRYKNRRGKMGNSENPFNELQTLTRQFSLASIEGLPPFQGGLAGYLSYDLCHYLEDIPYAQYDDMAFPDIIFGAYDTVISFDHLQEKSWIISSGLPKQGKERISHAQNRLNQLEKSILGIKNDKPTPNITLPLSAIKSNFSRENYIKAIQKCQQYIKEGDIFEVNLSQRFKTKLPASISPFDLYCAFRKINPAPFGAFLNFENFKIASGSPERFLVLSKNHIETRPIKGTAPRGATPEADKHLAEALSKSAKDRSENVMIVDLMRNDLSKVCKPNSVMVTKLCGLESHSSVHHLVSVIKGQLAPEKNLIDLIKATFPGGSITGAPKIRAMEIISELEPHQRGPYCGSIGFIGFNGEMDLSITIRTYTFNKQNVTFQAGGAIVLHSNPDQEYQETLNKAQALIHTLLGSNEYDFIN